MMCWPNALIVTEAEFCVTMMAEVRNTLCLSECLARFSNFQIQTRGMICRLNVRLDCVNFK